MTTIGIAWGAPAYQRASVQLGAYDGRIGCGSYRQALISLVTAYCGKTGRSEARVANLTGADSRLFVRIRDGGTCSVDTLNRTITWFATHWPADLAWPDGVERPAVTEPAPAAEAAEAA